MANFYHFILNLHNFYHFILNLHKSLFLLLERKKRKKERKEMFSNVEQSCAVWYDSSAKRPVMRIPFSSMIDVSAVPPLPHSVKLFIGGLEFEMGRDDVARVASHFSG